jgi:hypothetical protein
MELKRLHGIVSSIDLVVMTRAFFVGYTTMLNAPEVKIL